MSPPLVVLITGCSSGIGRETALALAREGYRVFATSRSPRKAVSLRQASKGLPLAILRLDVDDPTSARRAVGEVVRRAGRLDVLINNAGWGAFGSISEFTDPEMAAQFETNVLGPARMTREALPWMRRQGGGKVLHVGSLAGRMTFAGIGLYCASKHAVEAMTESMRLELRQDGVEVAVVEPGHIRTSFKDHRRKARVFLRGASAHQEALERVLGFGDRPKGPGPRILADRFRAILRGGRLQVRYPTGWDALLVPFLSWFVPDGLYDWASQRLYRRFSRRGKRVVAPPPGIPVALVTGASSGIGLATARRLARGGYKVYAGYRDGRKLARMREAFRGLPVVPLRLDVCKGDSVRRAVSSLLRREKRLDALVNNAGFVTAGFWEDLTDQDLRDQFDTNVFGVLRMCREALPALRAVGGRIVNMGSVSAFAGYPLLGPYAASKHALRAVTGALRMEETPHGVLVAEVDPGMVRTSIAEVARRPVGRSAAHRAAYEEYEAWMERRVERATAPETVAECVWKALRERGMARTHFPDASSRLTYLAKWLLPSGVWEWLLRRAFRWTQWEPKGKARP